jgi:hypothetical protein
MEAGDNTDGVHERGDDGDSGSQDGREGRNLRRQESEGNGNRAPDMWAPSVRTDEKKDRSGPYFNIVSLPNIKARTASAMFLRPS